MKDVSIIPFKGATPDIHPTAFIAPGCRIIGRVTIGADVSIWYNCVIRGDVNDISIGARTNVQDGTVIHCDSAKGDHPGSPTIIGEDCLIGHMAMMHGCTIDNHSFIGLGSIIMDGCHVESEAMLAAGAMLTQGKRIAARQLWTGRPAKHARDLSDAEVAAYRAGVRGYIANGQAHAGAVG